MKTAEVIGMDDRAKFAVANVEELTAGNFVPLTEDKNPPWFEPAVVTEVAPQVFRETVERHAVKCVTPSGSDQEYHICGNQLVPIRILWERDGLYLGLELLDPDPWLEEMMDLHEDGCWKTAQRYAATLNQWLEMGGPYPKNHDVDCAERMLQECLNPYWS
jgi:hypothetical protein